MSKQQTIEQQSIAQQSTGLRAGRHGKVAAVLVAISVAMLGAAYAAVPLYRIFCQVTGYGGTAKRVEAGSDVVLKRTISIRFDANTRNGMPWKFAPVERKVNVRIGETKLAFFRATNTSDEVVTGTASFNVSPEIAGAYFNKIECFCFTQQTLQPGQSIDMPVSFFIDPDIVKDPDAKILSEITLSYTFYPHEKEVPAVIVKKPAVGAKGSKI